jgi:uncharacterized membrane protein
MTIAILALVGIFVAAYLAMYHAGMVTLVCGVGHECETVNDSEYAVFLHIPVALWGLGFYVATFLVAMIGIQPALSSAREISLLLLAMSGFGVAYSAYLTYIELFEIHAICRYCVVSAILVTLIFLTSLYDLRRRAMRA